MRTIGFIGAYDKTDLIIYIAKLLTEMNKKVMIIDATTLQKAKYIVPAISPSKTYVTEFEGIDIAVGFHNYALIKDYLGMPQHAVFEYDYIFLDVDSPEELVNFDVQSATKNYFVTGFDVYSLKRGVEILSGLTEAIPLKKVFFTKKAKIEEEEYFDFVSLGCRVTWDEERIYFPFEQGDQTTLMENERVSRVKLKRLTQSYKDGLMYITEDLIDPNESGDLRKAYKQLEKGV